MYCQVSDIQELGSKNSWLNNLLQARVRILRKGKRKAVFLRNRIFRILMNKRKTADQETREILDINPGDLVNVRSKDEIRDMLDDREKYKGCLFIDEMYEHCNKTYEVLKKIDYFFDEARQEICKCKDTVVLEGVLCSGRQRLYSRSCDRNCFFFWHTAWLKKL